MKSALIALLVVLSSAAAAQSCPGTIEEKQARVTELTQRYSELSQNLDQADELLPDPTPSLLADQRRRVADLRAQATTVFQNLRSARLCLFRERIREQLLAVGATEDAQWVRGLAEVGECLGTTPATSVLGRFGDFFRNLFNHFWGKPQLTDADCSVLKRAYEVWSSLYDDRNDLEQNRSGISIYNVNAHNASFYYWAQEQRRGRIPPEGLTIFHADTHTDMGHVHSHINHWSQLGLREAHQATMMSDAEMRQLVVARAPVDRQRQISARVSSMSAEELRRELGQEINEVVHGVAQPLAAAQAIGVSNGNFVMCMPPWSSELPRTQSSATAAPQALEYDFCDANIEGLTDVQQIQQGRTLGFATPYIEGDESRPIPLAGYIEGECRQIGRSRFQVVNCNNEEQVRLTGPDGSQIVTVRQRSTEPFPFENYLTERDRSQGFLLDIDLDVFVSEGRDPSGSQSPVPVSYHRSTSRSAGGHGSHDFSNETDPASSVPTVEFDAIRTRLDSFFERLARANAQGYRPQVITIADSTILNRAMLNREENDRVGGNYTPACLSFILNYMVRTRLSQIYGTTPP